MSSRSVFEDIGGSGRPLTVGTNDQAPRVLGGILVSRGVARDLFVGRSSAAKDETLGPEPEAAITPEPSAPAGTNAKFDLGLGGAVVTDYVSPGITQTDSGPAIQGYVEPSYGIAYVNIWSSNVDFGEDFRGAEDLLWGTGAPQTADLRARIPIDLWLKLEARAAKLRYLLNLG